jgi:hypothetical protein
LLKDLVKQELVSSLKKISGPFDAVHIRNTDYETDYEKIILQVISDNPANLYVATDSQGVLDEFRARLTSCNVFNFTEYLSRDAKPIHKERVGPTGWTISRNVDALRDLIMPSFAQKFTFGNVEGLNGGRYPSGFSVLARSLRRNRIVLESLLHPSAISGGLGLYR